MSRYALLQRRRACSELTVKQLPNTAQVNMLLCVQGLTAIHFVKPALHFSKNKYDPGEAILELLLRSGADINAQDHKVPLYTGCELFL